MRKITILQSAGDETVDQAAAWITKLDKGLTDEEEQGLCLWLSESARNHREFLEQAKLWDRMDGLSRLADIFPEPGAPAAESGRCYGMPWRVAAIVLLGIGMATGLFFYQAHAPKPTPRMADSTRQAWPTEYRTEIGEQSEHTLPDGSSLFLNTNTLVQVKYSSANRLLLLQQGEVLIKVAHERRPLSVMVVDRIVQAVGTEFNLEITSDQNVELVVTEGVVMIGLLATPIAEYPVDEPVLMQPSSVLVASGQEVHLTPDSTPLDPAEKKEIEAEEIAVRLSWRNGNLIFRGESLEEAVSEVGRYTAVEFVFLDENAKKKRLSGMFKAGDVEGLLAALRNNFNISYEWIGDDKILLSAN